MHRPRKVAILMQRASPPESAPTDRPEQAPRTPSQPRRTSTMNEHDTTSPETSTATPPTAVLDAPAEPKQDAADTRARALMPSVEALIITSPRPVSPTRLGIALGMITPSEDEAIVPRGTIDTPPTPSSDSDTPPSPPVEVKPAKKSRKKAKNDEGSALDLIARAVEALNSEYQATGRSFRIEQVAGGYRMMTLPQFRSVIGTLQGLGAGSKLSRAAIDTLAIIAYRQPITRAQLEAIRGVACGEVLKSLMDRRLVTISGRSEELGRPLLYSTSKGFLDAFGLSSLKDLPTPGELGFRPLAQPTGGAAAAE